MVFAKTAEQLTANSTLGFLQKQRKKSREIHLKKEKVRKTMFQ